ncbi:MAG: hypothetical protein FWH37_09600 [Candidatus Bathyarchaeota archaeon]|nr:hypothetical protein [Candidatus Termiticorpusculum sp.]
MNRQKFDSAVGIGLMLVAMLSMIVMPIFVVAEENGYVEHWHRSDHLTWHVRAYAAGAFDNNYLFTSYTWDQDLSGATRTGGSVTSTSTKITVVVDARSYLANNIRVTSWVDSTANSGGSVVNL